MKKIGLLVAACTLLTTAGTFGLFVGRIVWKQDPSFSGKVLADRFFNIRQTLKTPITDKFSATEYALRDEELRNEVRIFLDEHNHWENVSNFSFSAYANLEKSTWTVKFSSIGIPFYECVTRFNENGQRVGIPKCRYDPRK